MSSVAALTGTSPVKALRPLLQVPRSALRATCEHHGIPFVDDPSNNDSDFDRVRAREAGLGLPRQGDGPTEAPSKEDVLELAAFLARSRSETEDAVDAVLARSTSAVLRWGAMKVDVAALLHGPGSRSEKQAALRRVVEVMSGRGKAVRASSAENVFAWLEARHAEYVETRDALHAMRVGERRSTPTQRNELRSALTRVLDVQTSLGGCILAPLRPQRLREKLPGTDTFARSTPNLQAPMELIVSPERSNRYSMVGSPGPATEEAAPKLQPNGAWVQGVLGRWNVSATYSDEPEGQAALGKPFRPNRRPRGAPGVEVPPALAELVVRRLTPYSWDELLHLHPWLKMQLRAPNHMLKWGLPVVCRDVDLTDPRILWLTMRNHMHHSDQRSSFARRQQNMVQMEARLGAENYAELVQALPSRWRSMTQEAVAALSVVAVPGTRSTIVPGLRAYSNFAPRHLLYNCQRSMQVPRGFKVPDHLKAGVAEWAASRDGGGQ